MAAVLLKQTAHTGYKEAGSRGGEMLLTPPFQSFAYLCTIRSTSPPNHIQQTTNILEMRDYKRVLNMARYEFARIVHPSVRIQ
jgi:hypothetical protein